jgi:tRNA(fMet)-specific endonuclease VapC
MSSLVDTDLLIDGLHDSSTALALLERLAPAGLAVSIISLGELFEGAYLLEDSETHLAGLRTFLAGYRILPLNEQIMSRFAQERATLRRHGLLIPDFDLLIAATALEHELTLVTRNRRHFERVQGLQLLP